MKNGNESGQVKKTHNVSSDLPDNSLFGSFNVDSEQETLIDFKQAILLLGNISAARLYYKCVRNKIPHVRQESKIFFFKSVLLEWKRQNDSYKVDPF